MRPGAGYLDRVCIPDGDNIRPYRALEGRLASSRGMAWAVRYACLDCGHEGWSNHREITARYQRINDVDLPSRAPDSVVGAIDVETLKTAIRVEVTSRR